jgi:predicted DNA-binding helix-hairpin-helix protein
MVGLITKPGVEQKLEILSADAQYDLACACGSTKEEHRKRSSRGKWIYPVTMPNGGNRSLFRTLISNVCSSDCKYCPLRAQRDVRRCSLSPSETASVFWDYFTRGEVFGLFLSSSLCGSADATMDRLNATARILRSKYCYRGYIHLKVIPGASAAAIEEALSLSTAVSLNIETPGETNLAKLSNTKHYIKDIIEPIKLISRWTEKGARYEGVKQTTQFIVGAAGESDNEIVKYTAGLYERLKMHRVYFSAYQRGLGDENMLGERQAVQNPVEIFTREHRLYQVDFLFRKYGFNESDIFFDAKGNLSMESDPKEVWAGRHPEAFPVNVNRATKWQLLKVPGLGPVTVERIVNQRRQGRINRIEELGRPNARLRKAEKYLVF